MKLTKLTFLLLIGCLMAPIAFGQLKNEKRNTPKPAPPPIVPGQKKPRQDPNTDVKAKMPKQDDDEQADETTPRPATSGSKKRNAIPNEIGSGR